MVLSLKRSVAAILCLAMILGFLGMVPRTATTVNAVSTNELANYNYSFEEAKTGTVLPTHWTMGGGVGNRASLNASNHKDGSYSLKVDNTTSPAATIGIYSAYIPVQPGDTVTASVDMMGTAGERGFFLRFYENDTTFTMSNHKGSAETWTKATSWTTKTVTATVPEGANYARIILYAGSSSGVGIHYFDNVVVTKTTPTSGNTPSGGNTPAISYPDSNMLENVNFSFEETVAGGTFPLNWVSYGESAKTTASVVTTDAYVGNSSLKVINTGNPAKTVGLYSAFIPVTPGDTLSLTMNVKGTGEHGAFLRFYASESSTSALVSKEAFKSNNNDWTTLTVTSGVEVPDGATVARILLWMGESAAGEHYYDNIILKKVIYSGPSDPANPPASTTPVAPSGPFPSDNVLQNYNFSFEETSGDSTFPLNWFNWNVPQNQPATVVTTDKTDGNSSLLIKNNNPKETVGLYSVFFPVTAGDIIKVSMDVKGTGEQGAVVRFYKSVTSSTHMEKDQLSAYSKATEWTKLTVTDGSLVPEGATVARILFWIGESGAGEHYYDNVRVTVKSMAGHKLTSVPAKAPTSDATGNIAHWSCQCGKLFIDSLHESEITNKNDVILPKLTNSSNLLAPYNPSFEWGVVGGIPVGWYDYASSKHTYEVTSGGAYEGENALKLTISDDEDHVRGIFSSYFELNDSMEALSVMMSVKGEGDAMFYMYYYNEKHERVANVEGDKGWIKDSAMPTWSQIYAKFPVPEGAKYGRILIYRTYNSRGTIYFDDILVKEYERGDGIVRPTVMKDSFENGASSTQLPWGWNYYTDATKNTSKMKYLELLDLTKDTLPEGAPTTAPDGNHILKFTQVGEGKSLRGIYSPYIDVSDMKGVYAGIDVYGGGMTQIYIMFYNENYVSPEKEGWRPYVYDVFENEWNTLGIEATVPEGAKYARILLMKSYTSQYCGTVYLDRAVLMETEVPIANVVPEVPELIEYDWKIATASHPRTYFTTTELRRIKKFARDEDLTSMGYSGLEAYTDLISEADRYLNEESLTLTWGSSSTYVTMIKFPLYPVLEDPSCREEFKYNWSNPKQQATMPYMTNTCEALMVRMQALTVAYSISGETKYAERAIQYATDMCNWKYWVGEWETILGSTTYHELSSQPIASCITGVASVYDLCFDRLTESQKTLMENALIEKGLEPLYHDYMPRMLRGRDMDHMSATYIACCAIMNENNIDRLAKYMNAAMQYTQWIFDWYNAGHNEGYDYAAYGIDRLFEGMGIMERTTGIAGMLDHPFVTTTLRDWILAGVETGRGTSVGFSDSPYNTEFGRTMCVMAQRGDTDMAYLLTRAGGTKESYFKLIYTNISEDYIIRPDQDSMNVITVESLGISGLRTGWAAADKLMVLFSDDYNVAHAHWEANSIYMAMDGSWLIKDPGYGSITAGQPKTNYDQKYAVNTIFVDGKPQSIKGVGSVKTVFPGELYGQSVGDAKRAYGKKDGQLVINKFDRNVIMLNHSSESYYVVLDDLAAPDEHIYGFNMYYGSYDRLEIDGNITNLETPIAGNHIAMLKGSKVLHYEFAGNPLDISSEYFTQGNQTYGPLMRASSKKTQNQQFMTVISVDPQYDGITIINDQVNLLTARSSKLKVENPDGWSWSSSNNHGQVIALPMGSQYGVNMFRAGAVGDWMSFPFEVVEAGTYIFSLKLGSFNQYNGTWQAYLDGEPIGEPYFAKSNQNRVITVEMGKMELTAGKHSIKIELIGDIETEDPEWGTLISMGVVVLEEEGAKLGYGSTKILESYDTESVLGATIRYGTVLNDTIISNRGTGTITAGGITTDGAQASVLGIYESDIKEGFAIVDGTSLKYGDLVLMSSNGPINLSADYRLAKEPIKNTDDDKPLKLPEDFDYDKPKTLLFTSATESRVVSVQVGNDAPFTVTIDGETVESTYADGLLTMTIPEGDHQVEIEGTHHCIYDRKVTHIMNVKSWATCTDPTIYYVSCYCGKNGTETFIDGTPKGHTITAVAAKEPTDYEDGYIAHYICKNCGRYFADAEGTRELSASDVIIPRLIQPADNSWIIWVVVGAASAALGATIFCLLKFKFGFFASKKKKADDAKSQPEEEA